MRGIAIVALLGGCSASTGGEDQPPILDVTSPTRGTTTDQLDLTVTGTVSDDHPGVRVVVNGVDAQVKADGSFSAVVSVAPGIGVIETHAIDASANDVRDVRAVLAGPLAPTDGSLGAPIAARVGADGLGKLGTALGQLAQSLDWKALALGMNPVVTGSGCNSIRRVDIQDLRVGPIGVGLPPSDGSLGIAVTIDDVFARMHVDFEAICIKGSTTVDVRATRANVNGQLVFSVDGGKLAASLPSSAVALSGFSFNASGVPGAIENLFKDRVRKAAEDALAKAIRDQVPPKVDEALGGLLAKPLQTDLLGHATQFTMVPSAVAIGADGMVAAVDARVVVGGGEGGVYVTSPTELAGAWQSGDVGIAVADDLINQLLGGLWASGAVAPTLSLDGPAGVLAALLDDDARSIAIDLSLPPQVNAAGGDLQLAIGDLVLSVRDGSDTEIQRFALTVQTSLSATPSSTGTMSVRLATPVIKAQVLAQSEVVDEPMTDQKLEDIVNGAWGLVGKQFDSALAGLPLPQISGLPLGAPSLGGREGYLVVDVAIE